MLANRCRNKKHNVQVLDCEVLRLDYKDSVNEIINFNPRIACFVVYGQQPSASSQNMEGAIAVSKILKKTKPEIKTLFVGGHVAALPTETLEKENSIDIIALNEGAYSISNLLEVENLDDYTYLKKVKGIVAHAKETILAPSRTTLTRRTIREPYLSTSQPAIGDAPDEANPPTLAAPAIRVRLHPRSWDIGNIKIASVRLAAALREN